MMVAAAAPAAPGVIAYERLSAHRRLYTAYFLGSVALITLLAVSVLGLTGHLSTLVVCSTNLGVFGVIGVAFVIFPGHLGDGAHPLNLGLRFLTFLAVSITFVGFITANAYGIVGKLDHTTICWLTVGTPCVFGFLIFAGAGGVLGGMACMDASGIKRAIAHAERNQDKPQRMRTLLAAMCAYAGIKKQYAPGEFEQHPNYPQWKGNCSQLRQQFIDDYTIEAYRSECIVEYDRLAKLGNQPIWDDRGF